MTRNTPEPDRSPVEMMPNTPEPDRSHVEMMPNTPEPDRSYAGVLQGQWRFHSHPDTSSLNSQWKCCKRSLLQQSGRNLYYLPL